jgi:putative SOS response-associated peptidase YedK
VCYSAQVEADYKKYVRLYGADVSIGEFFELYWMRDKYGRVKIPRAMDAAFAADPDVNPELRALVRAYEGLQLGDIEKELFEQRERLVKAEKALEKKITKAASENRRIATNKIAAALERIQDLRRDELKPADSRIFPGSYVPVMIWEDGKRVVKPMRYQCRPAGKPANYDELYPGTYNARRDNLERFWRNEFGRTHGLVLVKAFYEHVVRPGAAGDEHAILEFRPDTGNDMLVACLWSHWTKDGEPDLWSFAFITDEPPVEVLEAGHDRCIIPIRAENIDAWLRPDPQNLAAQYAILDDRERPFYQHRDTARPPGGPSR